MITKQDIDRWGGKDVFDPTGEKIGTIEDFYLDKATYEPEWIIVKRDFLGLRSKLVPYMAADWREDGVVVCYEKDMIEDAPGPGVDGRLSDEEELNLMEHFALARDRTTGRLVGSLGRESGFIASNEEESGTRAAAERSAVMGEPETGRQGSDLYEAHERERAEGGHEGRGAEYDRAAMAEKAAAAHPFSAGLDDEESQDRRGGAAGSGTPSERSSGHYREAGTEPQREDRGGARPLAGDLEGEQVPGSTRLVTVKRYIVTERVERVPVAEEEFEEGGEPKDERRAA